MSPEEGRGYKAIDEAIRLFKEYPENMSILFNNRPEIHDIIERLINSQKSPEDVYRLSAALKISEDFDDTRLEEMVSFQERDENPSHGSIIRHASSTFRVSVQHSSAHEQWLIVGIDLRSDWPEGFYESSRNEETERLLGLLRMINPESFHGVLGPSREVAIRGTGVVAVYESPTAAVLTDSLAE